MSIYIQKVDLLEQRARNKGVEERRYIDLYVYNKMPLVGVVSSYNYPSIADYYRIGIDATVEVIQLLYSSTVTCSEQMQYQINYNINNVEYSKLINRTSAAINTDVGSDRDTNKRVIRPIYNHTETYRYSPRYVIGSFEAKKLIADFVCFIDNQDSLTTLLLDLQLR
jgi:hypothetical protein